MSEAGAPLVRESLRQLDAGEIRPRAQDAAQATNAPRLEKEHGRIDWSRPAQQVYNRIRGLAPWPGAFTTFRGQLCHVWGRPAAAEALETAAEETPGTLLANGAVAKVSCGDGSFLQLDAVQLEGRKRITAREFVNGARPLPRERFGGSAV
jgi:methionyl-tRNA formyltransferase